MDPGTVNTKILLAGWGPCGIEPKDATDTFRLATEERFANPGGIPKFYNDLIEIKPVDQV